MVLKIPAGLVPAFFLFLVETSLNSVNLKKRIPLQTIASFPLYGFLPAGRFNNLQNLFMHEVSELTAQHLAEQNMLAYFDSHDISYVAEDAVFRNLSTGEVYTGRAEIGAMLHYIYHVAFDAKAEKINYLVTEDKAFVEGYFKGRHIGEIAGIKPTEKEVDVPICVTYDLRNGLIQEARIYMLTEVLMKQLGVSTQ